jgi:hypothetical protein
MFMLQLFISLLVLSNVFHQTYADVGNETKPTDPNYSDSDVSNQDVERNLEENATVYNSTTINEKPSTSLPVYQPQNLGASTSQQGAQQGAQQGYAGGQGYGVGNQQSNGNFGAGKGALAKGKNVGADFVPPVVGPAFPQYYGVGNIYASGGGLWCEGCGGNLIVPPLPPIPPTILPPTYMWHDFPPLPPFPQIYTPAIAYPPPIAPAAPIMPPPMQQTTGMGQQVLQNPGFGMKGQQQQQQAQMPMQQQGQEPLQGQPPMQGQEQQMQGQEQQMQGQEQQMQGQEQGMQAL